MRYVDISGQRFGKLVAVSREPNKLPYKQAYWLFKCDCGNEYRQWAYVVRRGNCKSCGCWRKHLLSAGNVTHGKCKTPEYRTWNSMRDRCYNPRNRAWPQYGGFGITICDRWGDFATFYADMGKKPSPSHSLDRIDGRKGYSPSNCRWATKTEQVRNRWLTIKCVHLGRKNTLAGWCEELGLPYSTIHHRYLTGCRGVDLFRPIGSVKKKLLRKPPLQQPANHIGPNVGPSRKLVRS